MNIKLLFLAVSFLFVVKSNAQATLTNTGVFKVNSGTLVSTATGVGFQNTGGGVVTNGGSIIVRGNFNPGTVGTEFVDTYTSYSDYGQLIVDSSVVINTTQKITHQYYLKDFATERAPQLSFPFQNYYAQNFLNDLGLGATTDFDFFYPPEYYSAAMFYWHNSLISFEPVARTPYAHVPITLLGNGKRVSLNGQQLGASRTVFSSGRAVGATKNLIGTPNNTAINPIADTGMGFADYNVKFAAGNAWINTANNRGHVYNQLMLDARLLADPNYLRHIYYFGNPYPSNIDLSHISTTGGVNDTDGIDLDVNRIIKIQPTATITAGGVSSKYSAVFLSGIYNSGDYEALLIHPSEMFVLVLNNNTNLSSFQFTNGMKTFASVPKAQHRDGDITLGPDADGDPLTPTSIGRKIIRNASYPTLSNLSFGLQILDDENATSGSNFAYVVANQNVIDNQYSSSDFLVPSPSDVLYTVKDNDTKLKIQGIKMDESKVIPLGFKSPLNGDGEYVIKTSADRMVRFGGDASAYPSLFSFFDAAKDVVIPIDENFQYKFKQNSSTENRFFILYNKSQESSLGDTDFNKAQTEIAKEDNGNTYLMLGTDVKSDNPTIKIYSSAGQLLDSFPSNGEIKVKLKNYAPGVYLVQVEGLSGAIKMISSN